MELNPSRFLRLYRINWMEEESYALSVSRKKHFLFCDKQNRSSVRSTDRGPISPLSHFELLCARRVRLMSTGQSQSDDAWKLLEEKDKDLEIAARIGQSLLELNRELKNRNDFLEESLNTSNDTIVQLRHELQLRTNLLHAYVENEDEVDTHSKENVDGLQWRVKKLESENEGLRLEASNLKKLSSNLEEMERLHLSECSKNLDMANEKIIRLKASLSEKGVECSIQNGEVERLIKIVAAQTAREKTLLIESNDFRDQIDETMMVYDELSKDFTELQEKYTEVLSMLHDADEELRSVRRSAARHRTTSVDSLYDSLASELETSDSGLCNVFNTVCASVKATKPTREVKKFDCLQTELEEAFLKDPIRGDSFFEELNIPSKDAICASEAPENSKDVPCNFVYNSNKGENCLFLEQTPCLCKCSISASQPSTSAANMIYTNTGVVGKARFQFDKIQGPHLGTNYCITSDDLMKSISSDSLADYEGPKFGEPGNPGTRDLDFSLRRRGIKKEVEQEYARFRLARGLSPLTSSFFTIPSSKNLILTEPFARQGPSCSARDRLPATNKINLCEMWKSSSSKGLAEAFSSSVSLGNIVSRYNIPLAFPKVRLNAVKDEYRSQDNVTDNSALQLQPDALEPLGICNASRPFLPHTGIPYDCLQRSESLGFMGSLASCDFSTQQLKLGIITRPRPST